jgi:opacity protein-like surface antigen
MKKINLTLTLALAIAGMVHAGDTTFVQKKIALQSISLNGVVNGNGFGMQYVPMAGIRFGKNIILSGGPVFNSWDWKNTGYIVGTSYALVKESCSYSGHVSLSANFSIRRIEDAHLSESSIHCERQIASAMNGGEIPAFENLQYQGWEYSAGFRMNYRFRCGLLFRTGIGAAYTDVSQENFPVIITSRQDKIVSLQLSAGIGWCFAKMMDERTHVSQMIAEENAEDPLLSQR